MQALQTSLADARKALKELKDQQPARSVDEVKRLRQAAVELRAQTEAAQDALQEEQLRCKVFEDALEVRATELPGLDGKASLLADLAKLRGEATAATKTVAAKDAQVQRAEGRLAEVQARNAVLSQQLTTDRAELQRISTELARLNTREASETIAMLSKANAQLESEKGALLDYIQDSVDRGAQANTELAQKSEALANLEEDAAQLHAQVTCTALPVQLLCTAAIKINRTSATVRRIGRCLRSAVRRECNDTDKGHCLRAASNSSGRARGCAGD
jgi:chromosome segregation ATPase